MQKMKKKPGNGQELPTTQAQIETANKRISSMVMDGLGETIRKFEHISAERLKAAKNNGEFETALNLMGQDQITMCPYVVLDYEKQIMQDKIKKGKDGKYKLPNLDWKGTEKEVQEAVLPVIEALVDGAETMLQRKESGNAEEFVEVSMPQFEGVDLDTFGDVLASQLIAQFKESLKKKGILMDKREAREEGAAPAIRLSVIPEVNAFTGKPIQK
jgi:23S rRNA G2069 N7-methylase RlmK/C1962 C5-methylase RlmI